MAIEEVRYSMAGRVFARSDFAQEFSIEIPDKEADTILSSMLCHWTVELVRSFRY